MDEEQSEKDWAVRISMRSKTPVVGIKFEPFIHVTYKGSYVNLPPHALSFIWSREMYKCSVHSSKLATVQCMSCVKLKLPVKESFYCSADCFLKARKDHLARHQNASVDNIQASNVDEQGPKTLRSCGSWPSFADGLLENDSVVAIEQEEIQWVKVGCTRHYIPSMGDYCFHLRLECVAIDRSTCRHLSRPDVMVTDPVIVIPPPRPRHMIKLQKMGNLNADDSSDDSTFTVLTYNILSDLCARRSLHYCPSYALTWDYRRENLLNEIIGYGADIICLQEVQSDHFENFFEPQLKKYGYSVSYKKKTKELYANNQSVSDGCATFYRHDVFREISRHELEFDKEALPLIETLNSDQIKSETNPAVRLMKGNIALIVVLGLVSKGKFDHAFQHKICVVSTLVNALEEIASLSMPLLICGDMNSLPRSDTHQFITQGKLQSCQVKTSNPLNIHKHLKLEHSLKMASAYASIFDSDGVKEQLTKMDEDTLEPFFTNFTPKFAGTLDYIFFKEETLRVVGLLELLDRESIGDGLPTPTWSSDHTALMARFKILTPPEAQNLELCKLKF